MIVYVLLRSIKNNNLYEKNKPPLQQGGVFLLNKDSLKVNHLNLKQHMIYDED